MAVGDGVIMGRVPDDPSPPMFGVVNTEGGGDATVLWRNGKVTTVPQTELEKVFVTDAQGIVGQWLQLTHFPENEPPDEGGPPKSQAAAGLVTEAFGVGVYDAPALAAIYIIVATEEGEDFITMPLDADPAEHGVLLQPSRRAV